MGNKHMKRCLTSSVIRKMQTKTIIIGCVVEVSLHTLLGCLKLKIDHTKCWKSCGANGTHTHCWWE